MDSEISVPRLIAPRPLFMEPWECDEYAEIHEFIRERHDKNVNETKVHCRFYNISERDVDVIWCRGKEEEDYIYATVPPKRFFKILTFEGHPWIFRATEDGDRMAIHPTNATVHYPHRATCTKINSENGPLSIQFVFIKSRGVEKRTLKQLAIRTLGRHFKTDKILAENLPPDIMISILEYYANRISYSYAICPSEQNTPQKLPAAKTVGELKSLIRELESTQNLDLREGGPTSPSQLKIFEAEDEPSTSGFVLRKDSGNGKNGDDGNTNQSSASADNDKIRYEPPPKKPSKHS